MGLRKIHDTREGWLNALVDGLRPLFKQAGYEVPKKVRITCGFPSRGGVGARKRTIGQCWDPDASKDGAHEIFISPVLDDRVKVTEVAIHELAHAVVGVEHGHKAPFVRCIRAMKLGGKPTATLPTPEMEEMVKPLLAELGLYPHKAMTPRPARKQSTRLLKVQCPECGYIVRTTAKWLDVGLPTCCCGEEMVEV